MLKGIKSLKYDNFSQNNKAWEHPSSIKGQQFNQGGFPMPPEPPRMEGQPRTAPPNFTPQLPRMEGRPGGMPEGRPGGMPGGRTDGRDDGRLMTPQFDFGTQYQDRFVRERDLRRCLNRFIFIWLNNGNSFWFYPTSIGRQQIEGFRWRRGAWMFDRINIRRIIFFRCF